MAPNDEQHARGGFALLFDLESRLVNKADFAESAAKPLSSTDKLKHSVNAVAEVTMTSSSQAYFLMLVVTDWQPSTSDPAFALRLNLRIYSTEYYPSGRSTIATCCLLSCDILRRNQFDEACLLTHCALVLLQSSTLREFLFVSFFRTISRFFFFPLPRNHDNLVLLKGFEAIYL